VSACAAMLFHTPASLSTCVLIGSSSGGGDAVVCTLPVEHDVCDADSLSVCATLNCQAVKCYSNICADNKYG
jgi:hypothetical protein